LEFSEFPMNMLLSR